MRLGDTLKSLIALTGLTQKEVAARLNMAASTLGNYIQNNREPDYETLKRFAAYFDVSLDELLDYHPKGKTDGAGERQLLAVYRRMSPEHRAIFLEEGKAILRCQAQQGQPLSS